MYTVYLEIIINNNFQCLATSVWMYEWGKSEHSTYIYIYIESSAVRWLRRATAETNILSMEYRRILWFLQFTVAIVPSLSRYRQILAKLLRIFFVRRFIVSKGWQQSPFKSNKNNWRKLKWSSLGLFTVKKIERGKNPYTFLMYEECNKIRVRTMLQSEACRINLCRSPFTERFQRAAIIFLLFCQRQ